MKVHTIESDRYKLVTRLSDREMETEVLATQSREVFYMALANLFIFTYFSVCPPPCMQACKPEHKPAKNNNKKSSRPAHPLKKQPHSPLLLSATCPLQSTNLFGLSLKKRAKAIRWVFFYCIACHTCMLHLLCGVDVTPTRGQRSRCAPHKLGMRGPQVGGHRRGYTAAWQRFNNLAD